MKTALLSLIILASTNAFSGEFHSCVDSGGGCNPLVFNEFQSQSELLIQYPVDDKGRFVGAGHAIADGYVVYDNFNGCKTLNNQQIPVYSKNGAWDQISRFIPAELPRNGGLVCIDSLALDTSGQDPYQAIWYNSPLDTSLFYFSEFAVYGFKPTKWNNEGTTGDLSNNVITKYLFLSGTGTKTTTNTYNSGFRNFIDIKNQASSVNLPILCSISHGENIANPDCRGNVCQAVIGSDTKKNANLGICTYP